LQSQNALYAYLLGSFSSIATECCTHWTQRLKKLFQSHYQSNPYSNSYWSKIYTIHRRML